MGKVPIVISAIVLVLLGANVAFVQQNQTSFFVTSVGSGMGGNLGGLAGADKHCQTLATALGAGGRTWRAYLEHPRGGRRQRARSHREGTVA